jgi:hypothetical protein
VPNLRLVVRGVGSNKGYLLENTARAQGRDTSPWGHYPVSTFALSMGVTFHDQVYLVSLGHVVLAYQNFKN